MTRRNPCSRADQIAVFGAVATLGTLAVACGNSDSPPATTTTFSLVDAGALTKGDMAADAASPPSSVDPRDSANPADATVGRGAVTEGGVASDGGQGRVGPEASALEGSNAAADGSSPPLSCGIPDCPPGGPCADLTIDRSDLIASIIISQRTFGPNDCAIAEGCILQTGTRTLLRFDTGTVNTGTADVTIGDPTQNVCFTFSQCHQHYHFRGVGRYTLYQSDGTTVEASGHKQGFCLEDVQPVPQLSPTPPSSTMKYSCTNQGLQVGWEDIYPNDIDCQWIDITGVPSGNYILSVVVNAGHDVPESNYDNNEERVPVTIP